MNTAWNIVMKLVSMKSSFAWELFWFMEGITILVSIGATSVLGWIVGVFIGEPFGIELFMGFIVIYLVNEHYVLKAMDIMYDSLENSNWLERDLD